MSKEDTKNILFDAFEADLNFVINSLKDEWDAIDVMDEMRNEVERMLVDNPYSTTDTSIWQTSPILGTTHYGPWVVYDTLALAIDAGATEFIPGTARYDNPVGIITDKLNEQNSSYSESSEIISDSLLTILDAFSYPWEFFPELGQEFFDDIKKLRGKKIDDKIQPTTGSDLDDGWPAYNAVFSSHLDIDWEIKLSALLYMLETKVSLLQRLHDGEIDQNFDVSFFTKITEIKDAYSTKINDPDERNISEFNLFTTTGVYDSLNTLLSVEDETAAEAYLTEIKDYYSTFDDKVSSLFDHFDPDFEKVLKKINDLLQGIIISELTDGGLVFERIIYQESVWNYPSSISLLSEYVDTLEDESPGRSRMDLNDFHRENFGIVLQNFCGYTTDLRYDVDQEFVFLCSAITELLYQNLPTPAAGAPLAQNSPRPFASFNRIFERYIDEKIKLYRALAVLKFISSEFKTNFGTYEYNHNLYKSKHMYSKRVVSQKVKLWYDALQAETDKSLVVHERFNLDHEFKNAALDILMKEGDNKQDSVDTIERTKKIISVGLPFGLLDEFEKRTDISNPVIEISVHKRHWLDDSIIYQPKTFKFPLHYDIIYNDYHLFSTSFDDYLSREIRTPGVLYDSSGYTDFATKNTSILEIGSNTYSEINNSMFVFTGDDIGDDILPHLLVNLKSQIYEHYIYSLYGIDLSRTAFIEEVNSYVYTYGDVEGSVTTAKDEIINYQHRTGGERDYYNLLKHKTVFVNSNKFSDEILQKHLFDKIFHVLIDTEEGDFEPLDDTSLTDAQKKLRDNSVKYDDFYVTIDLVQGW
jgi:hypothetical protein